MKQLKALTVAFWNMCKQLPGFCLERFEEYADEMERQNEPRAHGGYKINIESTQGTDAVNDLLAMDMSQSTTEEIDMSSACAEVKHVKT